MIDSFSNFKRIFVFGCSFTHYVWPTWANVLHSEIPEAEFYNLGRTGSGNLFISSRVAEANKRFKFTDTDLVAIMWSSFTREDRYINGGWRGDGNIFNQTFYPNEWVKKFSDPDWYLIRDYALIELTKTYLNSLPCTSIMLNAFPLHMNEGTNSNTHIFSGLVQDQCLKIYKDIIKIFPIDLYTCVHQILATKNDNHSSNIGHSYYLNGEKKDDGHPDPKTYYEYLKFLKFPLTNKSLTFSLNTTALLHSCKTWDEIKHTFKYVDSIESGMF